MFTPTTPVRQQPPHMGTASQWTGTTIRPTSSFSRDVFASPISPSAGRSLIPNAKPAIPSLGNDETARALTQTTHLYAKDAQGLRKYQTDFAAWQTGNKDVLTFPFTPGTLPPGSRECYRCGLRDPPHGAGSCAVPLPLPIIESNIRRWVHSVVFPPRQMGAVPINAIFGELDANEPIDFGEQEENEEQGNGGEHTLDHSARRRREVFTRDTNSEIRFVLGQPSNTRVLEYRAPLPSAILSIGSDPDTAVEPFYQRIRLANDNGSTVRLTAQIDNGAMRNCISAERWTQYGQCLGRLAQSKTVLKVASGERITPKGRWWGQVSVGGVTTGAWFEVFQGGGAFDVILGKPWLHSVRAIHNYGNDEIRITAAGRETTLQNEPKDIPHDAQPPRPPPEQPLPPPTRTAPKRTHHNGNDMKEQSSATREDDMVNDELTRVLQIQSSRRGAETRYAKQRQMRRNGGQGEEKQS
ncbi:unnamed protein product [Mycena citricolor]|uniref:Uncharacterized protein n=1 Tax=Mycena citricolor TaxID=2018698 RepID=A0AAD2H7A2_9AGAR|nr:unnamed protein product [Mycena citricolor]